MNSIHPQTFFFYDLETSGLSARSDRIMQFAGQRTDLDLNPIGNPINLLVKLADDTLPSPRAIAVTGITPQQTQADGLTEAEFARFLNTEIFTAGTIATGYNSIRFDDEFIRHLFWRNFYDPYAWQWQEGRSRWDLLDVVRLTRAIRPDGINWPFDAEGKPTNRLELLTKLNNIEHLSAHDALSDVNALIAVTKLIKSKQPKLFDYLFTMRDKRKVQALVNLDHKQPFVYASGSFPSSFNKTTVAFPLTTGRNGNIVIFDLRYNLEDLLSGKITFGTRSPAETTNTPVSAPRKFYPAVKELAYNKCPAVAPVGVLEVGGAWEKIGLDAKTIHINLEILLRHPEFAEIIRSSLENSPTFPPAIDPESALYDAFLPDTDRFHCEAVRNGDARTLADFHPQFSDSRLPELLLHYKAKNFPTSLSESESKTWEEYRIARLARQAPDFLNSLKDLTSIGGDPFIIEELQLWYQSLLPAES